MTNLEISLRDTLERLEKRYSEITKGEDWLNIKDPRDSGRASGLDLAIELIKTTLLCWGEGEEDANK